MQKPKNMRIVKILMKRDNMSMEDACNVLAGCRHEVDRALSNGEDWEIVEGIIEGYLGLEMDYIFDIL